METFGQAQGSIDQQTKDKIDKLNNIHAQYDRLYLLCNALLSNFQALVDSQKMFGEHFNVVGMKEEEILTDSLVQTGNMHQGLDKQSVELVSSLQRMLSIVGTFKNAAVQDTMVNFERYTKARQEYDGACLRLNDLNNSAPDKEKLEEAQLICSESKKLMDQLAEDLTTKIVMLNEKRVQDLSLQLAEYLKAFRNYYVACNKVMEQYDINMSSESTAEFKALVGDDSTNFL